MLLKKWMLMVLAAVMVSACVDRAQQAYFVEVARARVDALKGNRSQIATGSRVRAWAINHMIRTMLQAKLHRVRVTHADLHYEGSCGIDEKLLETSGIREFQHVDIYNINNGERFTTYAIKAPRGSREISLNGAAARKVAVGDLLIICAFSAYSDAELEGYRPVIVLCDENNEVDRVL
jgi:aspartate 1-decarboxylase